MPVKSPEQLPLVGAIAAPKAVKPVAAGLTPAVTPEVTEVAPEAARLVRAG